MKQSSRRLLLALFFALMFTFVCVNASLSLAPVMRSSMRGWNVKADTDGRLRVSSVNPKGPATVLRRDDEIVAVRSLQTPAAPAADVSPWPVPSGYQYAVVIRREGQLQEFTLRTVSYPLSYRFTLVVGTPHTETVAVLLRDEATGAYRCTNAATHKQATGVRINVDEQSTNALSRPAEALTLELLRSRTEPLAVEVRDPQSWVHARLTAPGLAADARRAELAARLQPERPDMRILYMSGYTGDAIIHHGVLDAGFAFLEKPFTPDTLAAKVRSVLDARQN
ncbi:MAG: hypothetical protein DMF64_14645 [Acidobacteria bacterium]|nr:MAG: hypothetical protein DMF64_14645 [Acidobacteriota bacterium]